MNILVCSSLLPGVDNPVSGTFIIERIKILSKTNKVIAVRFNNIFKKRRFIKDYTFSLQDNSQLQIITLNMLAYQRKFFYIFKRVLLWKIKKIIEDNKIDIVHVHFAIDSYLFYELKKKYGIPYFVTVHGSDIHTYPFEKGFPTQKYIKVLEESENVFFVAKHLLDKARSLGYSGNNAVVINNGINRSVFYLKDKNFSSRNHIGFIGNLIDVKRANILPDLIKQISNLLPDMEFLIIGDGDLRGSLEKQVYNYGLSWKVKFTGRIKHEEVPGYLSKMKVLMLPSRDEGFPCVVKEAYSMGVPVIGTDIPGIREAVMDESVLVGYDNNFVQNFAKRTTQVAIEFNGNWHLVENAMKFSWDEIVRKEMEVYN